MVPLLSYAIDVLLTVSESTCVQLQRILLCDKKGREISAAIVFGKVSTFCLRLYGSVRSKKEGDSARLAIR